MSQDNRQGLLQGLVEMLALGAVFNWLEKRFGFGKGCSCTGFILGIIILCIALFLLCNILTGTNYFKLY
jgi:hypothetical protein